MSRFFTRWVIAWSACCLLNHATQAAQPPDEGPKAIELFEQRIMPIFRSPDPSSCVQCHLSAVDLKDYILPSHEATFLSLRDQGLIELDHPAKSKILQLIQMGDRDSDRGAKLIHKKKRNAEYKAFAAWIEACCSDEALCRTPAGEAAKLARPDRPDPVIRHARISRILESFERNVWSQRMRCFPCHTPGEIDPNDPKHAKPAERQRELVRKFGKRMNVFKETPEETFRHLVQASRSTSTRLPMLNVDDATKSLLVLKPTAKLPPKKDDGTFERASSIAPVSHMGGLKMHVDDQSYKSFIAWIEDYSRIVADRYESAAQLPQDNWYPTQKVLRLKDCPDDWPVGTPVQLFVYNWDDSAGTFEGTPAAFTQGTVTPRRIVNGALFTFLSETPNGIERVPNDITSRTRLSIRVDLKGAIEADPTLLLGQQAERAVMETEGHWADGFRNAEVVSFGDASR